MTRCCRLAIPSLLILALALAGCSEAPRPLLANLLVQPETARALGYRIAWPSNLGLAKEHRVVYAELLGDRLAVLDSGNVVAVVNATSGKVMWRDKIGQDLERFSRPRRDGNRLILCSETRAHIYDIEQGGLLNVFKLAATSNTTPLIYQGNMIHGTPTGLVYAQSIQKGLHLWSFQTGGAVAANPTLAGAFLISTSTNGNVIAYNPQTGVKLWNNHAWGRISAQTAGNEDLVYVASEDRSLYAFSRPKGSIVWRYYTDAPLKRSPLLFGDNLYQFIPEEGLVALNAQTGKKLWSLPWHDAEPFMLKGGKLHILRPGQIVVVTPDDGLVLTTIDIPAVHFILKDPNDALYLFRHNGPVLKLIPM